MKNKSKKVSEKSFAISGIFLMIMSLFAFSVILSENVLADDSGSFQRNVLHSGSSPDSPDPTATGESSTGPVTKSYTRQLVDEDLSYSYKSLPLTTPVPVDAQLLTPTADILAAGGTLAEASSAASAPSGIAKEIGDILGGKTGSSGEIGTSILPNHNVEITTAMMSDLEKAASDIQLNADGTLKSFIKGDKLYTVGADGALTSIDVTSIDIPLLGTFTGLTAHLIQGALWALVVATAIRYIGPVFGLEEETANALSTAAAVGIMTAKLGLGLAEEYKGAFEFLGKDPYLLTNAAWIGIGVAVVVFLLLYTKEEEKIVSFSCLPWQAPTGGERCEECNKQGILPCSEYQCKSLGQSCELLNKGTNEEKCVWVNRQDVNPPTIEPWEDALLDDYRYAPDNTILPPDRGVKINYLNSQDNCIPAFTPLRFGVVLNEPAKCKIDVLRKQNFEEMSSFMSGGLSKYNHTYTLSLPGTSALELANITIQNDGNYELYVRCQDANGNSNTATFVFKYCVDPGADTTPPLIVTTSILNGLPIAYNQSSIDLEVYINEPSQCRWSHNNRDYDSMEEEMQCSTNIFEYNAQMLYKCSTTLTGLKDRTENKFYFRCKDQPNAAENKRNTNAESYEFTLIGTQPLVIDSVTPNDTTIKDSTESVKVTFEVKTSSGFREGEAICYYSDTGNENDFIKFFETQSFEHSQDLFLIEGSYEYFIKCTDLGGNSDHKTINFSVETDLSSPLVVRVYKEENFLKLITDEKAKCVYSTFGCNYEFDEGTQITVVDKENHFTDWNVQTDLFIKCQDDFGNRPLPNQCSITVRASDF